MEMKADQRWIMDRFVRSVGMDALRPGVIGTWLELGFDYNDLQKTTARVTSQATFVEEWARTGRMLEVLANEAEAAGHAVSGMDYRLRSSFAFGTAHRRIFAATAQKVDYVEAVRRNYDKVLGPGLVRRVEIPFGGTTFPGLLHLPSGAGPFPAVVVLPGMDMIKEFIPDPRRNVFTRRGLAALTIDGPGQGESNVRGLRLTPTNGEEAASAAIDLLVSHPAIDPGRIGAFGMSLGSYTAARLAATEPRLRGTVSFEGGIFYDKVRWVTEAEPHFFYNLRYMTGLDGEELFAALRAMTMMGYEPSIRAPYLLMQSTHDELTPLEEAQRLFDAVAGPKEMILYSGETHVLGGVIAEALAEAVDWLADRLAGVAIVTDGRVRVLERRWPV